jgi:LmbE family N-acetylglucosaminyl deacetylase
MMAPGSLQRLLIASPHFDDAVFSCGRLLDAHPGSIVVTIFAGPQPAGQSLTEWDRAAGFQEGDDVMAQRCREDSHALASLGSHPVRLGFHDSQYRRAVSRGAVQQALQNVIQVLRPHALFLPWGLFHSDHALVHQAGMRLRPYFTEFPWFLYEEAFYRRIPDLLAEHVARTRSAGLHIKRVTIPSAGSAERKAAAVAWYRSQLKALSTAGRPGHLDIFEPERFWYIEPSKDIERERLT